MLLLAVSLAVRRALCLRNFETAFSVLLEFSSFVDCYGDFSEDCDRINQSVSLKSLDLHASWAV